MASALRIAFIGTRGTPPRYGGFETCVDEVGRRLAARGHNLTVYCRGVPRGDRLHTYAGMRLVHLPALKLKAVETLSHMFLSTIHALFQGYDAAIVFNAANSPLVPILRAAQVPVAIHMDGLEWQRSKWGRVGRRYYVIAERLATRVTSHIIADARALQNYYHDTYGVPSVFLPYGAPLLSNVGASTLVDLRLTPGSYHLVVARLEPENNIDMIISGYRQTAAKSVLVIVGDAPYGREYITRLQELATDSVRFLGSVWNQRVLNELYANCSSYIHGHSVGGTNPSLLRAVGAGAPTLAYDVPFSREVLGSAGRYFLNSRDVTALIVELEANASDARRRAADARTRAAALYDWNVVAQGYESLFYRMTTSHPDDSQMRR